MASRMQSSVLCSSLTLTQKVSRLCICVSVRVLPILIVMVFASLYKEREIMPILYYHVLSAILYAMRLF